MARIEEVSRQLVMLVENSDRGFPSHMNLAMADRNINNTNRTKSAATNEGDDNFDDESQRIFRRLKDQNHLLTEVSIRQTFQLAYFHDFLFEFQQQKILENKIKLLQSSNRCLLNEECSISVLL